MPYVLIYKATHTLVSEHIHVQCLIKINILQS